MKVAKDLVVSLAYQVRTEDGVLVDESPVSAPLDYLHGHGSLISGLETALEGHEVGDKFDVAVGANDAYGQLKLNRFKSNVAGKMSSGGAANGSYHSNGLGGHIETGMRFTDGNWNLTPYASLTGFTADNPETTKTWCNVFLKTYLWALMNCR